MSFLLSILNSSLPSPPLPSPSLLFASPLHLASQSCLFRPSSLSLSFDPSFTLPSSLLPSPSHPRSYVSDKQNKGTLILHKEWKSLAEPHPYDLSVTDITAHAPEYREMGITLEDLFRPKESCFMLSNPHYGFQAEVSWGSSKATVQED